MGWQNIAKQCFVDVAQGHRARTVGPIHLLSKYLLSNMFQALTARDKIVNRHIANRQRFYDFYRA